MTFPLRLPFAVIAYDDFEISKKLFSISRFETHTLPVFTDLHRADEYARRIRDILNAQGDQRTPRVLCCSDEQKATELFRTLPVLAPGLAQIIIDPNLPGAPIEQIRILEQVITLDAFLEQLADPGSCV